jgi:hypothetical protein
MEEWQKVTWGSLGALLMVSAFVTFGAWYAVAMGATTVVNGTSHPFPIHYINGVTTGCAVGVVIGTILFVLALIDGPLPGRKAALARLADRIEVAAKAAAKQEAKNARLATMRYELANLIQESSYLRRAYDSDTPTLTTPLSVRAMYFNEWYEKVRLFFGAYDPVLISAFDNQRPAVNPDGGDPRYPTAMLLQRTAFLEKELDKLPRPNDGLTPRP